MCGIWAVFGSKVDVSAQCHAVHAISHRGPDAFRIESINHFPNCCLGFHRLAIVDDVRGMQPMRLYTHPESWLIYNGEIYNHKLDRSFPTHFVVTGHIMERFQLDETYDLKLSTACDGEPLIHLYDRLGPEAMADQLDGVFALCIVHTASRRVVLARDTFGVKPLYRLYIPDTGFLAVCSEAKGLYGLSHSQSDQEVDITTFPPGHVEVYDLDLQGRATFNCRTCFNSPGQAPAYKTLASPDFTDVKENIKTLFEAAVRKRLMADRRIGCLLSGGLDSSLTAALLVKLSKEQGLPYPIQSFAIGMEDSPDIKAARMVATHLGTEHHEIIFTPEEGLQVIPDVIYHLESYDVICIRSSVAMYLLSKYIRQNTDTVVVLSGEGSDELTQGYLFFHDAPSAQEADRESRRMLQDLHLHDVQRCDRATAAWGLEVRVPFLDHQFTSYYLSLAPEDRQPREGVEKHLLRSSFDDSHLLPKEVLWRRKEGFSDGISPASRSWCQVLQEYCDAKVSNESLEDAQTRYPHNSPRTKEALFYRQIFESRFPNKGAWVPYFWMPLWAPDASDPSARCLHNYL